MRITGEHLSLSMRGARPWSMGTPKVQRERERKKEKVREREGGQEMERD